MRKIINNFYTGLGYTIKFISLAIVCFFLFLIVLFGFPLIIWYYSIPKNLTSTSFAGVLVIGFLTVCGNVVWSYQLAMLINSIGG